MHRRNKWSFDWELLPKLYLSVHQAHHACSSTAAKHRQIMKITFFYKVHHVKHKGQCYTTSYHPLCFLHHPEYAPLMHSREIFPKGQPQTSSFWQFSGHECVPCNTSSRPSLSKHSSKLLRFCSYFCVINGGYLILIKTNVAFVSQQLTANCTCGQIDK